MNKFNWAIVLIAIMICVFAMKSVYERKEVAKVLAAEACSEGAVGMQGVMNVIVNRARHKKESLMEVISKPKQFYGYTAKNKEELYDQCKSKANRIVSMSYSLPDITNGAKCFCNEPPQWMKSLDLTLETKNLKFYKCNY